VLLGVGRVDEAEEALARALAEEPASVEALAQRAVLRVAQDRRAEALADARQAVALDPDSAAARIALSYALQAQFALAEARAVLREAVARSPEDPLAWARLAELEESFGALDAAQDAAERAAGLAPRLARTQMVLGFAALARIDIAEAKAAFARAIALDSAEPLARLGQGLARIRQGDLAAGRRDLEAAVALDPDNSLLRSYLGKAYFDEQRGPLDADQLQIAKQLDPNDPTPWFYDALRKQSENRPVEALRDLETSIALNDNRAVYRSRLLLDQDLAARGARLGQIYNDLGFEQLALVQGWRSLSQDPGDFSAHRLLADTYAALPRHEIAEDSELLQSQILQPLNLNPVQPRLARDGLRFLNDTGPFDLGYNEYTRLFTANDPFSLDAEGVLGTDDTLADNLVARGLYDNFSYSVGQFHFETDGFRDNDDLQQDIYNGFVQVQVAPSSSVFGEVRRSEEDEGDRALRFDPDNFSADQREHSDTNTVRIGVRHDFTPGATLLATYAYRTLDGEVAFTDSDVLGKEEEDVHLGELRQILKAEYFDVDLGGGYLKGDRKETLRLSGFPPLEDEPDLEHANLYVYGRLNYPSSVQTTVGLSFDRVDDSTIDRDQVNPKLGVMWNVTRDTLLRAAAFRTIKRTVVSSQTLEPTQIAGFNQFFDDYNGTDGWRYGIGLDHRVNDSLFFGAEASHRELDVPQFQPTTPPTVPDFDSDEYLVRVYGYWAISDRFAMSAEYRYEDVRSDPEASRTALGKTKIHRVPLELRWFDPSGWFARGRVTFVDQDGEFPDLATGELVSDSDRFWVLDGAVGYRFPHQRGHALLEVRNLLDENFRFQDTDPEDSSIAPDLAVLGRLSLRF
jgi:Tfp pilus assembly protein PilF